MKVYVLLCLAACWHSLGLGTVGLRGRIVHTITGAGLAWGALTPPSGWIQIGAALLTVLGARWIVTPDGRQGAADAGAWLWRAADLVLITMGRTLRWVLSPRTHEAPPVEHSGTVPRHRDTLGSRMATTPPAHLFEPEAWKRGTAAQTPPTPILAPVNTYADIVGTVVAGRIGFNDGFRRAHKDFGVSRSKFARDVRAIREGKAA